MNFVRAKAISETLKVNTSLRELHISFNNIGTEGAKAISEALIVNISLQKLYIGENNMCNEGKQYIRDALEVNLGIEQIYGISNVDHLITSEYLAFKRNMSRKKSARK